MKSNLPARIACFSARSVFFEDAHAVAFDSADHHGDVKGKTAQSANPVQSDTILHSYANGIGGLGDCRFPLW